MEIDLSKNR